LRLILTGGGTGGHIYPALEVGRLAAESGAELAYFGSRRGQEGKICARLGIPFQGFGAEPLVSLRTPRGWIALSKLLRAQVEAGKALKRHRPDVLFSTGGYSAGPVVAAARRLRIPYVLHDSNSVPGRSNRLFAPQAHAFAIVFRSAESHVRGRVVRTGQPIRKALREAAARRDPEEGFVLVVGGSQGSAFLNGLCPSAAPLVPSSRWLHSAGPAHAEAVRRSAPQGYEVVPFLEQDAMADAYRRATLAVARSGGTLAEFACFGLPSVSIPLPSAADDHQMGNAKEFAAIGATLILPQAEADPVRLADAVRAWLSDPDRRIRAAAALREWDVPDATERILALIQEAAVR
jgi:UDP-N-acetylglucosamine--N-acetylmuramyl-(pentapeptide) pyrophosphoryl-undecaprenol N-acetylglucosamine transferase